MSVCTPWEYPVYQSVECCCRTSNSIYVERESMPGSSLMPLI